MSDLDEIRKLAGISGPTAGTQNETMIIIENDGSIMYNGAKVGIAKIENQMGHEVVVYDATEQFAPIRRAVPNLPALINNAIFEWSQRMKNEQDRSSRGNLFG